MIISNHHQNQVTPEIPEGKLTDPSLTVCVSVFGRFHAYRLAQQLERRRVLNTLFTSYPYTIEGVEKNHIHNRWHLKTMEALMIRYLPFSSARERFSERLVKRFDREVAAEIARRSPSEGGFSKTAKPVLHGWSSFCLETLRAAKTAGFVTVVEKSSMHIEVQREIMEEEYSTYGLSTAPISSSNVARIMQEFEEANYIAVPSQLVYQSFLTKGVPADKLFICPLGVDTRLFSPEIKRDGVFRVAFAGGICLRKGSLYLLEAMSRLHLPEAEVVLAGAISHHEMRSHLDRYAETFRYVGALPQTALCDMLTQCSVFVLPSLEDGFGMVVTEAMACGLPVIVTENTGAKDVVREGMDGFIVPIRDVDALCEKITLLYENRELAQEMGRSARKRAEEYTWDHYGDAMIGCYRKIAGKP